MDLHADHESLLEVVEDGRLFDEVEEVGQVEFVLAESPHGNRSPDH